MLSHQKVGGLHFIRLGRISISWCVVKKKKIGTVAKVLKVVEYDTQHDEHMYDRAAHEAMLQWEREMVEYFNEPRTWRHEAYELWDADLWEELQNYKLWEELNH